MLELAEKDVTTVSIITFHMFKKLKERLNMLSDNLEIQIKLIEMKLTMSEIDLKIRHCRRQTSELNDSLM